MGVYIESWEGTRFKHIHILK